MQDVISIRRGPHGVSLRSGLGGLCWVCPACSRPRKGAGPTTAPAAAGDSRCSCRFHSVCLISPRSRLARSIDSCSISSGTTKFGESWRQRSRLIRPIISLEQSIRAFLASETGPPSDREHVDVVLVCRGSTSTILHTFTQVPDGEVIEAHAPCGKSDDGP